MAQMPLCSEAIFEGVSMMFWPNLLFAKALRSRVALSSLMSATKETTASEPLPVVLEVMVIEPHR